MPSVRGGMAVTALVLIGALSIYHPRDGHNAGALACGGKLTWQSRGIAIRQWRGHCHARARVCVGPHLRRCAWTTVEDSGPWGAARGREWQVQIRLRPGWYRRAVVDLPWALWVELGKPRFLSRVRVEVMHAPMD